MRSISSNGRQTERAYRSALKALGSSTRPERLDQGVCLTTCVEVFAVGCRFGEDDKSTILLGKVASKLLTE